MISPIVLVLFSRYYSRMADYKILTQPQFRAMEDLKSFAREIARVQLAEWKKYQEWKKAKLGGVTMLPASTDYTGEEPLL